jgi:hypothetical protein
MDTLEYWKGLAKRQEKVIQAQRSLTDALELLVDLYRPPVDERPKLRVIKGGDSCGEP